MILNVNESKSYLILLACLWNFIYTATPTTPTHPLLCCLPCLTLQHGDAAAVDPMPIIGQLHLCSALLLLPLTDRATPTLAAPLSLGDDSNKLFLRPAATTLSKSLRRRAVESPRNAILRFQLINICDNWLWGVAGVGPCRASVGRRVFYILRLHNLVND